MLRRLSSANRRKGRGLDQRWARDRDATVSKSVGRAGLRKAQFELGGFRTRFIVRNPPIRVWHNECGCVSIGAAESARVDHGIAIACRARVSPLSSVYSKLSRNSGCPRNSGSLETQGWFELACEHRTQFDQTPSFCCRLAFVIPTAQRDQHVEATPSDIRDRSGQGTAAPDCGAESLQHAPLTQCRRRVRMGVNCLPARSAGRCRRKPRCCRWSGQR
jgi:hypothetical protein